MATSVYSLGVAAGIGAMFQSISAGELPEVTKLVYEARENCLELVRREAQSIGAERVIGNRLQIREIGSGLVEIVAIGTAVRRVEGMKPATPQLIPQAVITDRGSSTPEPSVRGLGAPMEPMAIARGGARQGVGLILGLLWVGFIVLVSCVSGIFAMLNR